VYKAVIQASSVRIMGFMGIHYKASIANENVLDI
jgi:hypothetical protein